MNAKQKIAKPIFDGTFIATKPIINHFFLIPFRIRRTPDASEDFPGRLERWYNLERTWEDKDFFSNFQPVLKSVFSYYIKTKLTYGTPATDSWPSPPSRRAWRGRLWRAARRWGQRRPPASRGSPCRRSTSPADERLNIFVERHLLLMRIAWLESVLSFPWNSYGKNAADWNVFPWPNIEKRAGQLTQHSSSRFPQSISGSAIMM